MERNEDVLNEFKGFVQALKRARIEYSIVVNVEEEMSKKLSGQPRHPASITHGRSQEKRSEMIGR